MPRGNCAICTHDRRNEIDTALAAGQKLKELAAAYNVSAFSLSRHKARHLALALDIPESDADSLEVQARKWRLRSETIWQQATIDLDVRGQVQACQTAFRGLELAHRQEQRDAEEAAPQTNDGSTFTLQQVDKLMEEVLARDTPERAFLRRIGWELERTLTYSGNAIILGHVEQILRLSNSDLLGEFLTYEQRRIREGHRCDFPRRNDETFSQTAS